MTEREFFTKVIETVEDVELKEFAEAGIAKIDKANEARKVKNAEKAVAKEAEKAPIREAIFAVITAEGKTASTLIEEAGVEIKPQAIPSLLKPLIEAGEVIKTDIKVKGKGTVRGYAKPEA